MPVRRNEGFTLLEIAIVLGVIGIMIAIALPVYLGTTGSARDRAAQNSLRTALTAAKAAMVSPSTYTGLPALQEPGIAITATTAASAGPTDVVYQSGPTVITMAVASASGSCFYIQDDLAVGMRFARATAGPCQVTSPSPSLGWGSSW